MLRVPFSLVNILSFKIVSSYIGCWGLSRYCFVILPVVSLWNASNLLTTGRRLLWQSVAWCYKLARFISTYSTIFVVCSHDCRKSEVELLIAVSETNDKGLFEPLCGLPIILKYRFRYWRGFSLQYMWYSPIVSHVIMLQ